MGNAVATIVVSRWENALDKDLLDAALSGHPVPSDVEPTPDPVTIAAE
jgi:aerobic C4-dicarboxylate transport protein